MIIIQLSNVKIKDINNIHLKHNKREDKKSKKKKIYNKIYNNTKLLYLQKL